VVPDSAYISITAYKEMDFNTGMKYPVYGNSVLYVDAINFDSLLTGTGSALKIAAGFSIYQSSADAIFSVTFTTLKEDYTVIKIYDLEGREVKHYTKKTWVQDSILTGTTFRR
jgi:hypothetical protein